MGSFNNNVNLNVNSYYEYYSENDSELKLTWATMILECDRLC